MTSYSQAVPQLEVLRHFDKVKLIVPVLLGLFVGLLMNNSWLTFLYYFNGVASGFSDPIFGKDVSFYLFTLPVYEIISSTLLLILGVSLVVSVLNYILKGALLLTPKGPVFEQTASAHLSVIGSLIFLVLAGKACGGGTGHSA